MFLVFTAIKIFWTQYLQELQTSYTMKTLSDTTLPYINTDLFSEIILLNPISVMGLGALI